MMKRRWVGGTSGRRGVCVMVGLLWGAAACATTGEQVTGAETPEAARGPSRESGAPFATEESVEQEVGRLQAAIKKVDAAGSDAVAIAAAEATREHARRLLAFPGISEGTQKNLQRLIDTATPTDRYQSITVAELARSIAARVRQEVARDQVKRRRARFSVLGSLVLYEEGKGYRRTLFDGANFAYTSKADLDDNDQFVAAEYSVRAGADILISVLPNEGFRGTVGMRARLLRSPPAELTVLNYTEVNGSTLTQRRNAYVPDRSRVGAKADSLRRDLDSLCDDIIAADPEIRDRGLEVLSDARGLVSSVARGLPEDEATELHEAATAFERILREATTSTLATSDARVQKLCPVLAPVPSPSDGARAKLLMLLVKGIRNIYLERVVDGRVILGESVSHGDMVEVLVTSQLPPVNGAELLDGANVGSSTTTFSARFRFRVIEPVRVQIGAQAALVKRLSDVAVGNAREIPVNFDPSPGVALSLRFSPRFQTWGGQIAWDLLFPSANLNVFLLRYSASNVLEVGVGGSLGILNAMVHVGLGANLMVAPRDFFFVSFDFVRGFDTFSLLFPSKRTGDE